MSRILGRDEWPRCCSPFGHLQSRARVCHRQNQVQSRHCHLESIVTSVLRPMSPCLTGTSHDNVSIGAGAPVLARAPTPCAPSWQWCLLENCYGSPRLKCAWGRICCLHQHGPGVSVARSRRAPFTVTLHSPIRFSALRSYS